MPRQSHDKVVLRLTGSEAEHGLPLANLAAFVNSFRGALRDFDRQRRAERTKRGGHPSGREELVTSFRLVEFKPGSAIMTLEPFTPHDGESPQEELADDAELLALQNLDSFLGSLEQPDEGFDAAVADALENARRSLGPDGRIEIKAPRKRRRVVIDADATQALEHRVRRYATRAQRVSGRLHMIDVEPDQVKIRTGDNVDWICTYPEELERTVLGLLTKRVWATGVGALQSAVRGTLNVERIEEIPESEQTTLFSLDRVALTELLYVQGITEPQHGIELVPDDVSDEELDSFLDHLLSG
jgi:hypothetical protein